MAAEELGALAQIYTAEEFAPEGGGGLRATARVAVRAGLSPLVVELDAGPPYPAAMPRLRLSAPWLTHGMSAIVMDALSQRFTPGEVFLFDAIEWMRTEMANLLDLPAAGTAAAHAHAHAEPPLAEHGAQHHLEAAKAPVDLAGVADEPATGPLLVHHGDTLTDRKSVFQAHLAEVHSRDDVRAVMQQLLRNNKIARATHNISAFRIFVEPATLLADNDDDGEDAAGGKVLSAPAPTLTSLAELLSLMDARNVLVVVSRWYGGIQLGPDRFRHINNVARVLLEAHGYSQRVAEPRKGDRAGRPKK